MKPATLYQSPLKEIKLQLGELDAKISKLESSPVKASTFVLELLKVIFSGWTVIGILFLLLFQSPVTAILAVLPSKLKDANELQVGSLSLKTSIRTEALRAGAEDLSKTIPNLSGPAIDLLLRAPRGERAPAFLISFTSTNTGYKTVLLPSDELLRNLSELETAGLVRIEMQANESSPIHIGTAEDVRKMLEGFKKEHPGQMSSSFSDDDKVGWTPVTEIPKNDGIPNALWNLTSKGSDAVKIILKAVSAQLAPVEAAK